MPAQVPLPTPPEVIPPLADTALQSLSAFNEVNIPVILVKLLLVHVEYVDGFTSDA